VSLSSSVSEVADRHSALSADGTEAVERSLPTRDRIRAYVELTKPGITRMSVLTAAAGYYMALTGPIDWVLFIHLLVGTALAASGTNALNQVAERDIDRRMRRTRERPLPSGRLRAREAARFSWGSALIGLIYLAVFVNPLTSLVVAASTVSYVFVYTPLKRHTSLSTLVGGVPGALPILAGWTAAGNGVNTVGWVLFWILFLWQMPHFLALAWLHRDDYREGGLVMLSVFDPDGEQTAWQAMLYAVALLPVSLLPTLLGLTGAIYFFGAMVLGIGFAALGVAMMKQRTRQRARRLFFGSIVYLPLLMLLMVLDKLPTA
jgi:heme o synthase